MRRLIDVKRDMQALQQDSDTEMVHDKADSLLLETIRILLEKPTITRERQRILSEQIIELYEKLEKWYT